MTIAHLEAATILETSPGGTSNGNTGNVNGKDNEIGNGGDDGDGLNGDAKDFNYDLWAD